MMDETFHLTPLDVRRYEFGKAIRGYDPERVNQFRDQVAEELERLSRLNQELEAKARGFHEQLRAFRERDKAINEALVSAQPLRGDIREQAATAAGVIIRGAGAEADRIIEDAARDRGCRKASRGFEHSRRAHLAQRCAPWWSGTSPRLPPLSKRTSTACAGTACRSRRSAPPRRSEGRRSRLRQVPAAPKAAPGLHVFEAAEDAAASSGRAGVAPTRRSSQGRDSAGLAMEIENPVAIPYRTSRVPGVHG
jgi:DivIVA domain-containing protein